MIGIDPSIIFSLDGDDWEFCLISCLSTLYIYMYDSVKTTNHAMAEEYNLLLPHNSPLLFGGSGDLAVGNWMKLAMTSSKAREIIAGIDPKYHGHTRNIPELHKHLL